MVKKEAGKNKKTTPEYDSERETRVLLEQIRREVKVVAQQHGDIMKKLEQHDGKFERVEQRFDRLEMAVMENNRDIKELKLQTKELKVGQEEIKQKLDTAIDNHEGRISRLEEKAGV